ncbi:MAG: hypothetical protein SNJ71_00075 [Bacteroidales bacterium]
MSIHTNYTCGQLSQRFVAAMQLRILPQARQMALDWFDRSFANQGFTGNGFQPWKPRKNQQRVTFLGGKASTPKTDQAGRALLIKTGRLRRGTRATIQGTSIRISNNVPYARLHNEGFRGTVSVKAHSRNKVMRTTVRGGSNHSNKRRALLEILISSHSVKAHTRRVNMPARPFIKPSAMLQADIKAMILREIKKMFR